MLFSKGSIYNIKYISIPPFTMGMDWYVLTWNFDFCCCCCCCCFKYLHVYYVWYLHIVRFYFVQKILWWENKQDIRRVSVMYRVDMESKIEETRMRNFFFCQLIVLSDDDVWKLHGMINCGGNVLKFQVKGQQLSQCYFICISEAFMP